MSDMGNIGIDLTARALANAAGIVADQAFEDGPMHLTIGGTVDNITAPFPAGVSALADMMGFVFEASGANTGPVTLDIGGTGAKPVVLPGGAALVGNDISAAGYMVECFYVLSHDHYHAQVIRQPSSVIPSAPSVAGAVGVSTRYARADHSHPDSKIYTAFSAPHVPAAGELLSLPHGLGVVPKSARLIFECIVADNGYGIGERITVDHIWNTGAIVWDTTTGVDSVNCYVRAQAGFYFMARHKTTGAAFVFTANSWKYQFEAER